MEIRLKQQPICYNMWAFFCIRYDVRCLKYRKCLFTGNNVGRDELKKRITDMGDFLRKQPTAITEYDEPLVRRLIEKVTVYEDKFTVEFKSGVTVDVDE